MTEPRPPLGTALSDALRQMNPEQQAFNPSVVKEIVEAFLKSSVSAEEDVNNPYKEVNAIRNDILKWDLPPGMAWSYTKMIARTIHYYKRTTDMRGLSDEMIRLLASYKVPEQLENLLFPTSRRAVSGGALEMASEVVQGAGSGLRANHQQPREDRRDRNYR